MIYLIALGLGYLLEDAGSHADYGRFLQVAAIVVGLVHVLLILVTWALADR